MTDEIDMIYALGRALDDDRPSTETILAPFGNDLAPESLDILRDILALYNETMLKARTILQTVAKDDSLEKRNDRYERGTRLALFEHDDRVQKIDTETGALKSDVIKLSTQETLNWLGLIKRRRNREEIILRKGVHDCVFSVTKSTTTFTTNDQHTLRVHTRDLDARNVTAIPQSDIRITPEHPKIEVTPQEITGTIHRTIFPNIKLRVPNIEGITLPELLRAFKAKMDKATS